ncbi:hypothetical protein Scep_016100 [Stephania cephalantha]|uniref:Uncharacterized protein n=1 Tax=Stephania cephalantha TaxID=152367 RepID=A0AAP0INX1_9MAGN
MYSAPRNHRGRGRGGGGSDRGRGGGGVGAGRFSGNYGSYRGGRGGDGDGGFSGHIGQAGGRGGCSPYGGRGGGGGGGDGGRGGGGGNYSSYGGRGGGDGGRGGRGNYSYGGRGGGGGRGYGGDGGGWGRGRGGSWRSDLHQASSSSGVERMLEQLSLKPEDQLIRFSSRPPPGTIGEKFLVKTNHFQVEIDSSLKEFFHYNVSIKPEVLFSKDYGVIMEELRNLYLETDMNGEPLAYDGRKSFYTRNRLPFVCKEFGFSVRNKQYVVAISLVAVIDLKKFWQFLNGKDVELPQAVIQALDVVLRQTPSFKYTQVRRSFVSTDFGTSQLGDGLVALRGFYQSLRPTQLGLTVNIDVMAAAFIEEIRVIDFVKQILWRERDTRDLPLSDVERLKIKRALRGVRIEVTHRGNTRRTYSISGLSSMPASEETFSDHESGSNKHIVSYFEEKYGVGLSYKALPCLKVGNKGDISLPMEVCKIVGGQRYKKKLNKPQTANMLKVNNLCPGAREEKILKIVSQNNYTEDLYCSNFGIKISKSLTVVQARKLPAPQLKYHDSGNENVCQPRGGQWNMQNKKMFRGGTINTWVCINFERDISDSHASSFCSKLGGVCNDYRLLYNRSSVLPPTRAVPEQVEWALNALYGDAMRRLKPRNQQLDLIIVILPDNNGSLYGEVKRICDTKLGVMSQCFLAATVKNMKIGTLTIASEKINIKAGGRNVVLEDALLQCVPLVSDKPTIIFGADVTHPSQGNDTSPSIAAVVASLDWKLLGKYAPELSAQAARQERIEDMFVMCKAHFLSFHEENHQKPERIIFFRDGVSEGQIEDVLQHELKEIQRAWMSTFNESSSPPITFVMVQKRHHTRFLQGENNFNFYDKNGNVLPGTVVDTGICHPVLRDFYLNSHAGIQGTNRPAHYHVLHDDNNFTEDQIQTLCNNLCYTFERCNRAVSYVAPAYYAHLLAYRARHYLGVDSSSDGSAAAEHGESSTDHQLKPLPRFHANLKNRMFYI